MAAKKQELLRSLPSVTDLLKSETVAGWLRHHPRELVTECLRQSLAGLRQQIGCRHTARWHGVAAGAGGNISPQATTPHIRQAINATGIILHTGLGRAVLPARGGFHLGGLKGYCTLAVDASPASAPSVMNWWNTF